MHTEQQIESALNQIAGGRVLDVATGRGAMIDWLAETLAHYTEIVGIDIHPASTIVHDDGHTFSRDNIHYQQMDAHQLAYPDASFDTVAIMNALHHMSDPTRVLSEMVRVLKPGGHLIVMEMVCDNLTPAQQTHVAIHHWSAAIDRARGITHHETYPRAQIVHMLDALNLASVALYDHADLESDPLEAETLETLRQQIAAISQRASDLSHLQDGNELAEHAEDVTRQLAAHGFHGATELIAIGTV